MKIAGEYLFDGPREQVWELVRDPNVLASALPGTQSMKQISETEYEGRMNVRIGPVSGLFSGRVVVSDEVPPEGCTLTVEGRGSPGFAKGRGSIRLDDRADGTTLMNYEGELQIGGRLASVGQRLLDSVSKSIIRQGLDSMNALLQARLSPEPQRDETLTEQRADEPAAVDYQPPSEAQFAASVARDILKDLAGDLFAPENQTAWMIAVVALVAVVVGFLLGRGCRNE